MHQLLECLGSSACVREIWKRTQPRVLDTSVEPRLDEQSPDDSVEPTAT